jgi:hypothetical protein
MMASKFVLCEVKLNSKVAPAGALLKIMTVGAATAMAAASHARRRIMGVILSLDTPVPSWRL